MGKLVSNRLRERRESRNTNAFKTSRPVGSNRPFLKTKIDYRLYKKRELKKKFIKKGIR